MPAVFCVLVITPVFSGQPILTVSQLPEHFSWPSECFQETGKTNCFSKICHTAVCRIQAKQLFSVDSSYNWYLATYVFQRHAIQLFSRDMPYSCCPKNMLYIQLFSIYRANSCFSKNMLYSCFS